MFFFRIVALAERLVTRPGRRYPQQTRAGPATDYSRAAKVPRLAALIARNPTASKRVCPHDDSRRFRQDSPAVHRRAL